MNRNLMVLLAMLSGCVITVNDDDDKTTNSGETGITDPTTPPTDTTETTDTATTPVDPDDDLDGYPASVDCDDTNPDIHPDATELCDGIDNDCDSMADDQAAASIAALNYATLDDALAAALDGDTISVCPGAWSMSGSLLSGGTLALVGVAGSGSTTISETLLGTLFEVENDGALTLQGLTLADASAVPALILLDTASVTLVESTVTATVGAPAVAITAAGATLRLETSSISGNTAGNQDGGAINAQGAFSIELVGSSLDGNSAANGGAIWAETVFGVGTVSLEDSTVTTNTAGRGGGVELRNVALTGTGTSELRGNVATGLGGGAVLVRSPISGVTIAENGAERGGGVAVVYDPLFALAPMDNELAGVGLSANTASDVGGALYVSPRESVALDAYSSVHLNVAATSGGGVWLDQVAADGSMMTSNGADWGASATADDNTPDDVGYASGTFALDGVANVMCTSGAGCIPN